MTELPVLEPAGAMSDARKFPRFLGFSPSLLVPRMVLLLGEKSLKWTSWRYEGPERRTHR